MRQAKPGRCLLKLGKENEECMHFLGVLLYMLLYMHHLYVSFYSN